MIKKLWNILSELDRKKLIFVLFLVIIMSIIEAIGVVSIMPFLSILANPEILDKSQIIIKFIDFFSIETSETLIVYLGLLSLIIVVFSACFKVLTQYTLYRFSNLQRHYFSIRLFSIYLNQPYEFFLTRHKSDLVKNILSEVDELIRNIIQPIMFLISYSIAIGFIFFVLLAFNPLMAISIVSILFIFYFIIFLMLKKVLEYTGRDYLLANTQRFHACNEVFNGIKEIKINNCSNQYIEFIEKSSRVYSIHSATRDVLSQIPLHVVETIGYSSIILLAIFLVLSGNDISNILPILGLYGIAAYRMIPSAQIIYRSVAAIRFSKNIFELFVKELELDENLINNKESSIKFINNIVLNNINFSYESKNEKLILKNFNLIINKNSSIGIVGKSGSGKSTLMDIMLGLLKPIDGDILIDGVVLSKENISEWHKIIGYVPQNIFIADKTIAENIAFGIDKNKIDYAKLAEAASMAQIKDFIENDLIEKYDTLLGEHGIILSGGQKQRIGIARALYRDPEILFMDEATSALDMETELSITQAIKNLKGRVTLVIIAHRETVIKDCDYIINISI